MSKSRLRARIGDKLPTRPNGTFMNRVWVRPDLPQQKAAPAKSSSTTSSAAKLHPNPPRPRPFIKEEPVEETISDHHASPHRPYFKHSTPSSSSAYMPPSPAEARRVVIRRTNKPPLEHRLEDPDWLESSRREGRVAAEADREGRHFEDDCHVSNDIRASKRPYLQPVRARVLSNGGIELGHDRLDRGYRSDRYSSQGGGAQSADSLPSSCSTTHASWPPTINPSDSTSTMSKPLPSSSSQIPSPSQVHSKALPDYKPLFRDLIEKNAKARQADLGEPLTPALGTTHHDIDKLLTDDVYALLLEKGDEVRRALDILKPRVVEETKSPGEVSISEDKIRLEREGELFLANVFKGLLMQSEDEKEDGEVSDLSRSAQQGSSVLPRPLLNGSNHPPLPTPPMSSVSRNGTIPPATPPRSPIQHPPRWPRAYNASPSRQASRSPLRPSTTTEQETYLNSAVSHDFTPMWNATNGKGPNQSTITSNARNLSQGNQFSTEQNTLHWKTLPQSYPIPIPLDPLFFEPQKNHSDNSDHMGEKSSKYETSDSDYRRPSDGSRTRPPTRRSPSPRLTSSFKRRPYIASGARLTPSPPRNGHMDRRSPGPRTPPPPKQSYRRRSRSPDRPSYSRRRSRSPLPPPRSYQSRQNPDYPSRFHRGASPSPRRARSPVKRVASYRRDSRTPSPMPHRLSTTRVRENGHEYPNGTNKASERNDSFSARHNKSPPPPPSSHRAGSPSPRINGYGPPSLARVQTSSLKSPHLAEQRDHHPIDRPSRETQKGPSTNVVKPEPLSPIIQTFTFDVRKDDEPMLESPQPCTRASEVQAEPPQVQKLTTPEASMQEDIKPTNPTQMVVDELEAVKIVEIAPGPEEEDMDVDGDDSSSPAQQPPLAQVITKEAPVVPEKTELIPNPCHNVPGLWFIKAGRKLPGIIKAEFDIDKHVLSHWKFPSLNASEPQPNGPVLPQISLRLLCLPDSVVQTLFLTLGQPVTPHSVAQAIGAMSSTWPNIGGLTITVNSSGSQGRILLPKDIKPCNPSLDITDAVHEGVNTVQFIQLDDLSGCMFILYASPMDEENQPAITDKPSEGEQTTILDPAFQAFLDNWKANSLGTGLLDLQSSVNYKPLS